MSPEQRPGGFIEYAFAFILTLAACIPAAALLGSIPQ